MPWMNYAAIHFLEERLTPLLSLFEYGSGHSTLFFARLVHRIVSIETDRNWFNSLHARCPRNVTLVYHTLKPDGAYAKLGAPRWSQIRLYPSFPTNELRS